MLQYICKIQLRVLISINNAHDSFVFLSSVHKPLDSLTILKRNSNHNTEGYCMYAKPRGLRV